MRLYWIVRCRLVNAIRRWTWIACGRPLYRPPLRVRIAYWLLKI
jgi:hypothetical protein